MQNVELTIDVLGIEITDRDVGLLFFFAPNVCGFSLAGSVVTLKVSDYKSAQFISDRLRATPILGNGALSVSIHDVSVSSGASECEQVGHLQDDNDIVVPKYISGSPISPPSKKPFSDMWLLMNDENFKDVKARCSVPAGAVDDYCDSIDWKRDFSPGFLSDTLQTDEALRLRNDKLENIRPFADFSSIGDGSCVDYASKIWNSAQCSNFSCDDACAEKRTKGYLGSRVHNGARCNYLDDSKIGRSPSVPAQRVGNGYNGLYSMHENPPCNTLYVGNLPPNTLESELFSIFSLCQGYKRMCVRKKPTGLICFVEFESIGFAAACMARNCGRLLSTSMKGGMRLSYSKNPLGVKPRPASVEEGNIPVNHL